ncbi:MAG TPA: 3-dehydroquinate synthase [Vicinamibacterales bacterium]|nr:3-dehydroquinate synthase [Vicinamibacterales bacterium]
MTPDARPSALVLRIDTSTPPRSYTVTIAEGSTRRLSDLLDSLDLPEERFIVSNPIVWRLHRERFAGVTGAEPILIPDGERFKNLATASRIHEALIRTGADRAATIVAVGGGVVGDTAGFAAATYLRGVPVVQVPTTLLAQVDSAIGGKVGVNHPLGKNLIGAYHQPALVVIDPEVLATLPRRDFRAGLYEVVKYGVIASPALFAQVGGSLSALFAREPALLSVIAASCRVKASIVQQDEREAGPRRVLNFGHTIGHALEAVTKYRRFRHGEAVAYGMLAAAELALERGALAAADRDALRTLIVQMGPLPPVSDLAPEQILEAIARDKKVVAGHLHFILPTAIGAVSIVTDVTSAELGRAFSRLAGGI